MLFNKKMNGVSILKLFITTSVLKRGYAIRIINFFDTTFILRISLKRKYVNINLKENINMKNNNIRIIAGNFIGTRPTGKLISIKLIKHKIRIIFEDRRNLLSFILFLPDEIYKKYS